ncbi:MAG: hypothetical protein A2921_01280 [Candidatus Magasanikbacteria bacterium RIFCSPLOWO2_01_FULL_43_20b]|uniref:Uncharacterized protein n=1 Tax=Candidatus Magasanikbacteria bacterium RIFCSPLOWO2_12_FULL_43_12 TaxID=1798692 RepID=A0A1F6MRQ5_9BACT|nr:MAG: hypothetical protein A3C74_01665 [Candidatus Magasanikbacteria bacterium RIFCSPHIGHO2_02_FULL_44_13]OGH71424.1 MAG: hypothetical protein A3I93_03505 [Candidatus Magasanikbacteria bacterium RIFCSPLOWO2_02_FULL_43_22]OGH73363.1 MAG: hypothetical protein A2921_01280 [Candidatus Magasanikbacteria bacterium RIFCSPLOWO2_01_FULL_43_20b]OGH74344.1 MAG: hypothetical protein A3G00_04625 [Candidatus Magasanikbacteria bacterium RIFCSPLOWO2_12_FULL_43_12]
MSSLDRLIDLAKQTGSKLIVHDPMEGRDLVILGIDEFERLVLADKNFDSDFRDLSGSEMLGKINRDISIWRARQEEEEKWDRELAWDEELDSASPFDPFQEMDSQTSAWHSAGAVLENRYGKQRGEDFDSDDIDEDEEEEIDRGSFMSAGSSSEIKIEDVPFGSEQKTTPIPLIKNLEGGGWKEESLLEEEPVFYEEPV